MQHEIKIDRKLTVFILLVAIILFHIICNYLWLKHDNTYLMDDSHYHFLFSLGVFHEAKDNIVPFLSGVLDRVVYHRWHGIFVGYVSALFYFIFGATQDTGVMINSAFFLTILIFSTYGIGKITFDKKAGLLSAFIVGMYPLLFNHLRIYMFDLPLTAMISLSIYLLIKTDSFSHKIYSLLFALSVGLGILTKFNFVGFIIGPLAVVLFRVFTAALSRRKITLGNILIFLFIIAVLVFSFFKLKWWEVFVRFYECSWLNPLFSSGHRSFLSLFCYWGVTAGRFLLWALGELMNNILSFFFFVVFIVSLIGLRKKKVAYKKILYLWILLPLFFLGFLFHYPNIDRYLMPILPAVAIVSGIAIAALKRRLLRKIIIVSVVLFGLFQYFSLSYNLYSLPEKIELELPDRIFGIENKLFSKISFFHRDVQLDFRTDTDKFSYPSRLHWVHDEIIGEILERMKYPQLRTDVFFIDSIPEVYEPMEYITFVKEYPINIYRNGLDTEEFYKARPSTFQLRLELADYVAITEDLDVSTVPDPVAQKIIHSREYFFKQTINDCVLVQKFKLPDGNNLSLFKKRKGYTKLEKLSTGLYFSDGRIKLYHKGSSLTQNVGFGSGFKFKGKAYRSMQAQWDIKYADQNKIVARARWQDFPVIQEWNITVLNDKEIFLNIRFISEKEVEIENTGFVCWFSHKYKEWETQGEKVTFGKENILISTRAPLLASSSFITLRGYGGTLPAITLLPEYHQFKIAPYIGHKKDSRRVIFILDKTHQDTFSLPAGEYDFFSIRMLLT